MKWLVLAALALGLASGSCVKDSGFLCGDSAQCGQGGVCEPGGACSFADLGCQSGRRYGSHARGGIGGLCTGGDGGVGPEIDARTADGPVNLEDCFDQLVMTGSNTACVRQGSQVTCWGSGNDGELGDGSFLARGTPQVVPGLAGVTELVAGGFHLCARQSDGKIMCWGGNAHGQLAQSNRNNRSSPSESTMLAGVGALSLGRLHSCGLFAGVAKCWGSNDEAQLGDGTVDQHTTPTAVVDVPALRVLAAGGDHTCAIAEGAAGEVWCWGANDAGQLGVGDFAPRARPVKSMLAGAVELVAGNTHTCAVKGDRTVWCWGANYVGQLGTGGGQARHTPMQVHNISNVAKIAGGFETMCAVITDGSLWCWGNESSAQTGSGIAGYDRPEPIRVLGLPFVLDVASGYDATCVRTRMGLRCFGSNSDGAMGDGSIVNSQVPRQAMITGALDIQVGDNFSCARKSDGLWCWGADGYGTLGDGNDEDQSRPVMARGSLGFKQVSLGDYSACAVTATDGAMCWGSNGEGQLGLGGQPVGNREMPTAVPGLDMVAQLSVGVLHACARKLDGSLLCWGNNVERQLGDGSNMQRTAPTPAGITGVLEIGTGYHHSCARVATGVTCWGENDDGQLGDATTMPRTTMVSVVDQGGAPLGAMDQLSVAWGHACARTSTRTYCWGDGYEGQIGDGGGSPRSSATEVAMAEPVLQVVAGGRTTCAVKPDHSVLCWGRNDVGQVGDGTAMMRRMPTPVSGLTAVEQVAVGGSHACARKTDGTVWCWGNNDSGELGIGTDLIVPTPRATLLMCP